MTDDNGKIDELKNLGFSEMAANAWVKANGKCAYCGADLLQNMATYYCGVTEHILPKSKYENRENEILNAALSCIDCNQIKGQWDPNEGGKIVEGNDPLTQDQREKLIERVKDYIQEEDRKTKHVNDFEKARAIIRVEKNEE